MPIDPNILLQIKPPQPLDSPDVVAERQLKLQQAQEQRRQVIETAQDNAAIQTAIQTHLGPDGLPDMEGALKAVYATNARAGGKLQSAITASREAQYKAHEASRKADEADAEYFAKQTQGQTADTWPATFRRLSQTDPQFAQMMGPTWDASMPAKVQAVVAAGTATKDFAELKQKAHESLVKGDDRKGLAALINAEPDLTPDSLGRIFQTFRKDWGGSPSEIAPYLQLKSIDEAKAMARQHELGQKEVETLAETHARNQQIQANEEAQRRLQQQQQDLEVKWHATSDANEKARLRMEQQRIGIELERLKDSRAQTPEDQEKVQGYIEQLKTNPSMSLNTVPAAKGMRDAVVKALRQEGYDLGQPLTSQTRARIEFSKAVEPQITQVRDMADQINKLGLMGTLGGRWRSLISGESGASSLSGLTPAQKQLVGQFVTQSGLLVSAVGIVHGGARGGGSPQLLEQLKPLLDPHNKDLDTFLGNLAGAHQVVSGYSHMGDRGPTGSAKPPPAGKTDPLGIR